MTQGGVAPTARTNCASWIVAVMVTATSKPELQRAIAKTITVEPAAVHRQKLGILVQTLITVTRTVNAKTRNATAPLATEALNVKHTLIYARANLKTGAGPNSKGGVKTGNASARRHSPANTVKQICANS